MNRPAVCYVGLGSNLGDREAQCQRALALLRAHSAISVGRHSSWYETEPVGPVDQPPFLNGVVELQTSLSPQALLAVLLRVERQLGRIRTVRHGPRSIDLDLLLYNDHVVEQPDLILPHPRLAERAFVLVPLAEIAPHVIHPVKGRSIAALLADLHLVHPYRPVHP